MALLKVKYVNRIIRRNTLRLLSVPVHGEDVSRGKYNFKARSVRFIAWIISMAWIYE